MVGALERSVEAENDDHSLTSGMISATGPFLVSLDLITPPLLQGSRSPLLNTMLVALSRSRPPYKLVARSGCGTAASPQAALQVEVTCLPN